MNPMSRGGGGDLALTRQIYVCPKVIGMREKMGVIFAERLLYEIIYKSVFFFFLKQILFRLKLLQAGPVLPFIPVYSME